MSVPTVGSFRSELEAVRTKLREGHLNAVREVLKDSDILAACREVGHEFRDRLLAPVVAVFHMIAAALWPDFSFQAAWHVFGSRHVGSGSLAKARGRLPEDLFDKLSRFVAGAADRLSGSRATWRGHRVVDLDGTCVSMEDNPDLKAEFGVPNTRHGPGRYPVARLVAGTLWGTMTIIGYAVGAYTASEQALAMRLLPSLRPGDLLVGDRHFAGANLYAAYLRRGLEFLTRVHQRLKIGRLRKLVEYSTDDLVVQLPVGKKHRREDPDLPGSLPVRLIHLEARVRGKFQSIWLATSLVDAAKYPAAEIARLYAGRWRIETLFRELKVASGADVLRSKSPSGVRKELAARVMALNLVRCVMIQAAVKHGKEPTRLSFSAALRLVVSTSLRMSAAPVLQLGRLFEMMLERVAAAEVSERPGRDEPRALTREWKHYPHLRVSRAEWRRRHAA